MSNLQDFNLQQCLVLNERWVLLNKSQDSYKPPQQPLWLRWEISPPLPYFRTYHQPLLTRFYSESVVSLLPLNSFFQKMQTNLSEMQKAEASVSKMSPWLTQRIFLVCPSVLLEKGAELSHQARCLVLVKITASKNVLGQHLKAWSPSPWIHYKPR